MERSGSLILGVIAATLLAGPLFVVFFAVANIFRQFPEHIFIDSKDAQVLFLMLPAVVVGACISLIPNIIGANIMADLADEYPFARSSFIWAIVGASTAFVWICIVPGLFDAGPGGLALVATSAMCAVICRVYVNWS